LRFKCRNGLLTGHKKKATREGGQRVEGASQWLRKAGGKNVGEKGGGLERNSICQKGKLEKPEPAQLKKN